MVEKILEQHKCINEFYYPFHIAIQNYYKKIIINDASEIM